MGNRLPRDIHIIAHEVKRKKEKCNKTLDKNITQNIVCLCKLYWNIPYQVLIGNYYGFV